MNRANVIAKSKQMAAKINEIFGTAAIFRGQQITLAISSSESALNLESGGFRESAGWRIRFPATVQPPPKMKEKVEEVGTGRIFYITGIRHAAADASIAQEHLADADLA